jgi:predicted AlkP superfamily phosphohydrolase/phosphomutase
MRKVIIVGLDACDYDLTLKLMNNHEMPRLAELRDRYNFSRLKSVVPPNTPPGWTSMTTGVNPGKHGIYYFYNFSSVPLTIVNSTDSSTPRIWDYVGASGGRSVVVNVPVTYPAGKIQGALIAGIPPWFFDERSVYPSSLMEEPWRKDYEIDAPMSRDLLEHPNELVSRAIQTEGRRTKVFLHLLEKEKEWRFGMIVLTALDRIQHKLVGKSEAASSAVCHAYHEIDSLVGKIVDKFPDANVLVVSDHGFSYTPVAFYPNSWLYKRGYVKRKSSTLYRVTQYLHDHLDGRFLWMPLFMTKRFQGAIAQVRSIDSVDTENSTAFFPGTDGVLIVKKSKKEDIESISKGLADLIDEFGEKICGVYGKNQIYSGDKLDSAPELLIVPRDDINIRSDPFSEEIITKLGDFPRGNHGPNGIFFAAGPDIAKARELVLKLEDVAPTALALLGIAPPEFMDGRAVKEIFSQRTDSNDLQPASVPDQNRAFKFSRAEEDHVMENLRRLGYT